LSGRTPADAEFRNLQVPARNVVDLFSGRSGLTDCLPLADRVPIDITQRSWRVRHRGDAGPVRHGFAAGVFADPIHSHSASPRCRWLAWLSGRSSDDKRARRVACHGQAGLSCRVERGFHSIVSEIRLVGGVECSQRSRRERGGLFHFRYRRSAFGFFGVGACLYFAGPGLRRGRGE